MVIHEASSSYQKKYKCPYCNMKLERKKLISHIDKKHSDLIPEGFSATRIVFNIVNKKEKGTCTECGKETDWNESKARYERICNDPKCKEAYLKKVKSRMINTYGTDNLLGDPKHQEKMLANRKISGKYKFSDGGEKTYTGSYEKNCLEFFDKVLGCNSIDIITPGPVIEYEFEGKKHIWITDIFYVPYNLVIEVKDGGSNPNNRPMESYRAKQIAKEKAIIKGKTYNYLRLTNNNFTQLFEVFGELKMQLLEDNTNEKIVKINEMMSMASDMGSMIPSSNKGVYIEYMKPSSNIFQGEAFSPDTSLNSIFRVDNGKIVKESKEYLEDCKFNLKKVERNTNIINSYKEESIVDENFIFCECTGFEKKYSKYDANVLESIIPNKVYFKSIEKITEASLLADNNFIEIDHLVCKDMNGYFLRNKETGIRTESRDSIDDFNKADYKIIERGILV